MTDLERFELAREIVRHEDGLVHQRVTWLLIVQGLLFNAFVSGVGLLDKFKGNVQVITCIELGLFALALVGISTNLTAANAVFIAFRQIGDVRHWWEASREDSNFPALSGTMENTRLARVLHPASMLFVLIAAWLGLFALTLFGTAYG